MIYITEYKHYVDFESGNIAFSKAFSNSRISESLIAVNGFLDFYSIIFSS